MHELSIAVHIVELAAAEAERIGAERVEAIYLKVGALSGVVPDALRFAFDVATQGTPLEGTRLEIEDIPVILYCPECAAERIMPDIFNFSCSECGTPTSDVRSGRELEIAALEIREEEKETTTNGYAHADTNR